MNSLDFLKDYISKNPLLIVEPTYVNKLSKLKEINSYNISSLLSQLNLERSSDTYVYNNPNKIEEYKERLEYLKNVYQPEQRTNEWYLFRYNHITASNAWKALGTHSSKNELIYEKCQSMCIEKYGDSLTETPMSWGHKYEPLTAKLYEFLTNTTISDFGCIEHKEHTFLAASPDGIVTGDINYGRMIEIKNVVSRIINGIPKKDYYIQMQLQMEVCDLDECDFVETKFSEYAHEEDFLEDIVSEPYKKGVICVFIKDNVSYHYEYMPFNYIDKYNEWLEKIYSEKTSESLKWFRNLFWKLEVYSCILVKRKKDWFKEAIIELKSIWNIISEERNNGNYSCRAPKRREIKVIKIDDEKKQELESLFEFASITDDIN
jgi:putative phage-type endonuclease